MNWTLKFLPEAQKDFEQLAGNQKLLVAKALDKVVQNPVSIYEGGYGKPLGSKSGTDLSGLLKIKLRDMPGCASSTSSSVPKRPCWSS